MEDVKTFTYLGSIIDEHGGSDADVKARIGKARAAYLQLKNICNSKQLSTNTKKFPPIIGRFVPFIAVSAANCINIPCMRSAELTEGTPILDENGEKLGKSTVVGRRAVSQVVLSRILMASPGMTILPFVMQSLEKQKLLIRYPWLGAPIQISLVGLMLSLVTPLCCAVFPQISSIPFHKLEPDVQAHIKEIRSDRLPSVVYYNKGL
ncbi:unnamed protein product [Schistosoma curassoni]|uniref:Sideroflexin n=1 Tax=Schistosoma curassoni TaxID=6186 RepID=A0A3P8EVD9_9TREM|nr:unnamed protein product [Schistosoma curassoni]